MGLNIDRPRITLSEDRILHNGKLTRVVFTKDTISIGCTDISVDAAKFILRKYLECFPDQDKIIVFQKPHEDNPKH